MAALIIGMETGPTRPSVDGEKAQLGISCTVTRCTAMAFPCKLWPKSDGRLPRIDSASHSPALSLSQVSQNWGWVGHLWPPDGGNKNVNLNLTIMRRGENITAAQESLKTRS